jgi:mono/diheme cytochrome c family protein
MTRSRLRWLVAAALSCRSAAFASQSPDFARDVLPIFEASCTACHGADLQESELRLDSEAALSRVRVSGPIVVAGDSEASPLVRRLTGADEPRMPMGGDALSAEEIAAVRSWIDSLEPRPFEQRARTHWAFNKPVAPDLPPVENAAWPRNGIDAFVLATLENAGRAPSPEADQQTLIRRLSLDLIGLPPTLEQVDAFVADPSPDAYGALVDRLLSSPRYGERWARPWLDLARYADTQGYEKDGPRSIWKYRDWVINALNRDMSFRQFTIEQIAGDMLPDATLEQRIATGFHRNTLLNQEGGVDDEEARWETLVDRANTTATVWLGATLACAQCHNHKFDPFSQRDYYQFLAFFDNSAYEILKLGQGESWVVEPELSLPSPEQRVEALALEAELDALRRELATPTPALAADQIRWEAAMGRAAADWIPLRPDQLRSRGGASLTVLEDRSILASGDNPEADTYEIELSSDVATATAITGFRLEALEHPSLPHAGPGRDEEGNFFLSSFEVEVEGTPVELDNALANDFQTGYEAARALSNRPGSGGWALDSAPSTRGLPRQAVFVLSEPFALSPGERVTLRLRHEMRRASRNLGRFRLSLTTVDDPLAIVRLPARLHPVVAIAADARTEEQAAAVAAVHRAVTPLLDPAREKKAALEQALAALEIPTTLVLAERDSYARPSTPFRVRGSFMSPGERVYANTPPVLPPLPGDQMPNRLGLAHWLVDEDNPLTARVTVNRLWEQLFGRGLVETSENFGTQGSPPSHPELLDWLATRFMAEGWSLKSMLRTIVTSATYRQSSAAPAELWELDPYNRLLARGPRIRVEAEMVRDVALAVSGLLINKVGGPSVFPYQPEGVWNRPYSDYRWRLSSWEDRYRRGIYTFYRRTAPYPSLTTFDAPSRELCTARRVLTNTPLQALTTLNDPVFFEAAQYLASRMMSEVGDDAAERARHGFRLAVSRYPTTTELDHLLRFYRDERARFEQDLVAAFEVTAGVWDARPGLPISDLAAWTMVANVVLNLDATLTKE